MIAKSDFDTWFRQVWDLPGASTRNHPAPFPYELAYRLVRMFSFTDDVVLDPFSGTGTTMLAALAAGRNSIGVEIDADYCRLAARRLREETSHLFSKAQLVFQKLAVDGTSAVQLRDAPELYQVHKQRGSRAPHLP